MSDTAIQDLKQFIVATVSQQLALQTEELEHRVEAKINAVDLKLSQKIDNLSVAVGEAIDASNSVIQGQLDNHEGRIVKLERHPA